MTLTRQELESKRWQAADILRGQIDAADYKNYIFSILFLKRLSDRFDEEVETAVALGVARDVALKDRDEHEFFVPESARWEVISSASMNLGETLNIASHACARDCQGVWGLLPQFVGAVCLNHPISRLSHGSPCLASDCHHQFPVSHSVDGVRNAIEIPPCPLPVLTYSAAVPFRQSPSEVASIYRQILIESLINVRRLLERNDYRRRRQSRCWRRSRRRRQSRCWRRGRLKAPA